MKKICLLFIPLFIFTLDMVRSQTMEYEVMLQSLNSHTVPTIKSSELEAELKKENAMFIIDTRSSEEYKVSHLQGAQLIDFDQFTEDDVKDIPKSMPVVVYCSVGYRSEKIGEKLLKIGFKNVKNLYGGIFQWKNESFEIVNKSGSETDSIHAYNRLWSVWLTNGIKVY